MLHKKQKQLAEENFDIVLHQIIVPVTVDNNQSSARFKDTRPFRNRLSERIWCSVNKTKCSTRENAGFARNTRMYSGTEKLHPLIRQKTAESALNYYLCVNIRCIII